MMDFEDFLREANTKPDYNTNAGSYYKDLARKNKLIELLSKRIWGYEEKINEYLKQWDKNLEEFDDEVIRLLVQWLEDGTLSQIINEEIFSWKADKVDLDRVEKSLYDRSVNIKDMGAMGDGVTDDTLAIQQALDTKKSVFIPAGNYLVTDTLTYYTKQEIYGVGDNSNILSKMIGKPVMSNDEPFFNTNFHDFRIEGHGYETHGIAMLDGYEHFYMDKVSIVGVGGDGLHLENIYGLHANALHIIGLGSSKYGIYGSGINGCKFSDMLIKTTTDSGIYFDWTYKNTVKDSIIEANLGNGIYSKGGQVLTLQDLYFEGNGSENGTQRYDIHIDDAIGAGGIVRDHSRLLISDNYFFSRHTVSTVRVSSKVKSGTIKNNFILEGVAKQPYQLYRYDLDVRNEGRLTVKDIEDNSRKLNGQASLIAVQDNDLVSWGQDEYNANVRLIYTSDGITVSGDIPCEIFTRVMRMGHMTNFIFEIKNINATGLPDNMIVDIIPPVQRSVRTGHYTAPIDFIGASSEVLGIYGYLGGAGSSPDGQRIRLKKVGTTANPATRFDTSNLKDGIHTLRGNFIYY